MNARLRRKIHAQYLEWAVLIVQDPVFHVALQAAPLDMPWRLNRQTLRKLPPRWLAPFRRWNLQFYAARVASIPNYSRFEAATSIPLKIWARDSPQKSCWTFNAIEDSTSFARPDEVIDTSFIPATSAAD